MKESYFLFLGFGLISQAVLCFAVISLLDGGTFTSSRNTEKAEVDPTAGSNLEPNGSLVCKQPGFEELLRNVKNICDASAYTSKRNSGESRIKKLKKEISEDKEKKILIEEKGQDASTIKNKEADKSDNDSGKMMEGEVPNDVLEKDSILNVDPGMQEVKDDVVKPYVVVAVPHLPPQGKQEQLKEQLKSVVNQDKQQLVNLTVEQQSLKEQHFPANTSEKEIQTEDLTQGGDLGTTENSVGEELLEPASKEDDIVSFSQWAEMQQTDNVLPVKEQEKQDQSQTIAKPAPLKATGIKLTKNFASPDCTAKILAGNPESQGSGNVISNSRDEYILNKCTDKAWFVVELCESIKALKIQIANFELYSSSPKVFRVYIGNIYPGREKDWVEFGTFTYEDERSIQQFTNEEGVLGKYAKVEVLSHHGTEHYCPISLFRVYGISEIDLISDDNDDDPDDDDHQEHGTPEEKGPENPLVKSVKTISDAVVTAVKNIVFKNPQNTGSSNSSLHGSSMRHVLKTGSAQLSLPRISTLSFLLATQYDIISPGAGYSSYNWFTEMILSSPCVMFSVLN
ncbi:SUN domain-containing ossification factor [Eurytemora carolleeae]|uniref:SUN domain-containing ossification factor n=1 Tax=Eurytemora carolleeae TaxID=1294199 RepID=UPI000C75D006|nr:SUN domain-containing ossification factor [Eurytemora carolleeae]|eukprot:XP_023345107.1 SUN domain-containing ossification factor-like [Eurytemora affinis]